MARHSRQTKGEQVKHVRTGVWPFHRHMIVADDGRVAATIHDRGDGTFYFEVKSAFSSKMFSDYYVTRQAAIAAALEELRNPTKPPRDDDE